MAPPPNRHIIILFSIFVLCMTAGLVIWIFFPKKKKRVSISTKEKTIVKLADNVEIVIENVNHQITPGYYYFEIKDVTGGSARWFRIAEITENRGGNETFVPSTIYKNNTFRISSFSTLDLNIYYSILNTDGKITTNKTKPITTKLFNAKES